MSEEKIIWNGNKGRTVEGGEFRKSEDGKSVYEKVGKDYVPASAKPDSVVDLSAITWSGDKGSTVNGRHFRKSGDSIYEFVKDEWIPISKPEAKVAVVEKTEAAAPSKAERTAAFLDRLLSRRSPEMGKVVVVKSQE